MNQSKRVIWIVGASLALLALLLMGTTTYQTSHAAPFNETTINETSPNDTPVHNENNIVWPNAVPSEASQLQTVQPDPMWPEVELIPIYDGLNFPVLGVTPPDIQDRFYVVERFGRIVLHEGEFSTGNDSDNNGWQETPVLDLSDRITTVGECGLLGMAFPPDFGPNQRVFYVYYSSNQDLVAPPLPGESNDGCDSVLARFTLSTDLRTADPDSEERILIINQPANIHNGAHIEFGPDGALYIGTGDGISYGNPPNAGQRKDSLLGKMLRIHVGQTPTYTIPVDNPFIHETDAAPEIWAYGLRNPYRFSFDRQTGDLYIADVGQDEWEEVNFQPAGSIGGENYGWPNVEGPACYSDANCDLEAFTAPVYSYPHEGEGCTGSITGGYVYRGPRAALDGIYFFGDFCTRKLRGLQRVTATADAAQEDVQAPGWEGQLILQTDMRILGFAEDNAGHLYVLGREGTGEDQRGVMYRIHTDAEPIVPESVFIPMIQRAD
jgi:glucose/arabinose dehydrogenase